MRDHHDRVALAHAFFACLAGLVFFPAAVLVARFKRAAPEWWKRHAALNIIGILLLIITFALGMGSSGPAIGGDDSDIHHRLGLAIFLIALFQLGFGLLSHYVFRPYSGVENTTDTLPMTAINTHDSAEKVTDASPQAHSTPSHWQRLSPLARFVRSWHMIVGASLMALLYWQMWNGLHTEWGGMSDDGSKMPQWIQIAYWIIVSAQLGAYFVQGGSRILAMYDARLASLPRTT